jgi:hypothetical protein
VIAPGIRMEDLDEGGFALLEELVSRRDLGGGPELHVLHESGRVVSMLHTVHGPLPGPHQDVAPADAPHLRAAHGVDRVVLLDADAFDAVEDPGLVALDVPQPTLFATQVERFWSSPAVIADPEPVRTSWPSLARALEELGAGWVLLVVDDAIRLQGRLEAGLLTSVSTLRDRPDDVVLDLRFTKAEVEELLGSPDVAGALLEVMA